MNYRKNTCQDSSKRSEEPPRSCDWQHAESALILTTQRVGYESMGTTSNTRIPHFTNAEREFILFIPNMVAFCEIGDFTRNTLVRNYFAISVDRVSRITVTRI